MADIWSDKNRRPYLAITAHWIACVEGSTSLQLKAVLIAFHCLCGSYDGASLVDTVVKLLDRAGITTKVRLWLRPWETFLTSIFQGWAFYVRQHVKQPDNDGGTPEAIRRL